MSYGVSDDTSDMDILGFCVPDKEIIFPHLRGEILGFGKQIKRFEQYQQHHVVFDAHSYDLTIYSIVRYFQLCMENNPNMIDSIFVPQRCVLHCTRVGQMVRENRRLFLSKKIWQGHSGTRKAPQFGHSSLYISKSFSIRGNSSSLKAFSQLLHLNLIIISLINAPGEN